MQLSSMEIVGFVLLIAVAFVWDIRTRTIPNRLTLPAAALGAVSHTLASGAGGMLHAMGGAAAGFLFMLVLYVCKGVGAGDVKLFAAAGAWLGAAVIWELLLSTMIVAGGIGIAMLAYVKLWRPAASKFDGPLTFPLMAAVVPAAIWIMID